MKIKKIITCTIIICSIFFISSSNQITSLARADNSSISEMQYIRTLQLLLYPYIQDEVHSRYGEYAYVDLYDIKFESILIKSPANITIIVSIKPYSGPHNTISTDNITIQIDNRNVKITNYIALGS